MTGEERTQPALLPQEVTTAGVVTSLSPAKLRGRVEGIGGEHDIYPHRRWVTYRTYLDGALLGNAYSEDEGWRWIEDMLKLEARDA